MSDPAVTKLTPLQERTLDLLKRQGTVMFDADEIEQICGEVTHALAGLSERLDGERVFVSKHRLSAVLGCEAAYLAPDDFSWSPQVAGGQIAHRAIQLMLNWRGDPLPGEVIDEAIERCADSETGLGDWIAGLPEADRADLRSFAVDKLTKFMECFPPLDRRAAPTVESAIRWPIDGPIVLSGKVDLSIGRPFERESRKVIVDLKTGWANSRHRDDLRFYALVETLRSRIPPRKVASFYLDAGDAHVEDVTLAALRSTSRRVIDGVNAMIELDVEGRAPIKRPGPPCRWCVLAPDCAEGQTFLNGGDAEDSAFDDEFDDEPDGERD